MDVFRRSDLETLLEERPEPCVSLSMPTHRGGSEQDLIRWKQLSSAALDQLVALGWHRTAVSAFLEPVRRLQEDPLFWKHQSDGLAFFLAPEFVGSYRLPLPVPMLAVVGRRFHITPLLPLLEDGRFFVLALSQNAVRLLQGTHQGMSEVDLRGVPRSLAEALLTHDADEMLNFHTRPVGGAGSWAAIYHGHGVGIDDRKEDLLRYFQRIDRGLHALLRQERAPLLLAAVDYLVPLYREANTYPFLLAPRIVGNPDRLSNQELHKRAWELVQPCFQCAQRKALARFEQLDGTERAAAGLAEVLPAINRSEIETLFLARDRPVWGTFEPVGERYQVHETALRGDEDLLNIAAVRTLQRRGTVYVIEPDDMPDGAVIAGLSSLPLSRTAGQRS